MPVLTSNPAKLGLLPNQKEAGKRVDFKPDEYVLLIETKGYRLAWSRGSYCPCKPINQQTDQPDPNCTLCDGTGWIRFRPEESVVDPRLTGSLDALQQSILDDEAALIRGIMTSLTNTKIPYDQVMPRLEGMANVTTRHENKLGYYDRLVNLDSTIVYAQIYEFLGEAQTSLRYPVRYVNLLRSDTRVYTEVTKYNPGGDFQLSVGKIVWETGKAPPMNERLAAHYLTHPTWRIVEHPHAIRTTPVKFKTKSPVGDPESLPVQGVCKLEFML